MILVYHGIVCNTYYNETKRGHLLRVSQKESEILSESKQKISSLNLNAEVLDQHLNGHII